MYLLLTIYGCDIIKLKHILITDNIWMYYSDVELVPDHNHVFQIVDKTRKYLHSKSSNRGPISNCF